MMNFKKILLGSVAILLPGGFVAVAGYVLYKKLRSKKNAVQGETGDADCCKDQNKNNS